MSTPSFHQHFRQLTAMSPLQYQKWMRLSEAKRLMLNDHFSASNAAFKVGYLIHAKGMILEASPYSRVVLAHS